MLPPTTILPNESTSIAVIELIALDPPINLGKVVLKQGGLGITAVPVPVIDEVTLPTT